MLLTILCGIILGITACAKSGSSVASEARNGVVRVIAVTSEGAIMTGSAFGIGKSGKETDTFVTNHHVVKEYVYDEQGYLVGFYPMAAIYILYSDDAYDPVMGFNPSKCVPCEIVYESTDGQPDMAIIKASEPIKGRVAMPLIKNMDKLDSGDDVYALGFPGLSDVPNKIIASVESVTVTKGIVSRIYNSSEQANTRLIQHTAQINGGNSGGPLINSKGHVVGINTYTRMMSAEDLLDGQTTYSLSVTIDQVIRVLDDLDIEYDTGSNLGTVIIIIASVLLLAAIVVAVLMILKKKESQPYEEPTPIPPSPPIYTNNAPRLQCIEGIFKGKRFFIEGEVRIGRDPAKNNLLYPSNAEGISSVHCMLRFVNGAVVLQDLGSTYGTFLGDGRRLSAGETAVLNIGDRFWLGSEKELFVIAPKGGLM